MYKFILFPFALLMMSLNAYAVDPVYSSWGKAIKGYDTVAYFTEGKPVKGNKKYTADWNDATWYFSSQANADLFKGNPEKYAPQYGGYCAWAVSLGSTAKIDPKAWNIVDGKLYLNYNQDIQNKWSINKPKNIAAADKNWPEILKK